ncbi:hypothetical protein K440DRAFT_642127 [Wilcoxina mikolae CBS 423.85]|nr:hypothetical protein K440DRAFT_642127 [Wilcoxina mikolae CBS 423.85]
MRTFTITTLLLALFTAFVASLPEPQEILFQVGGIIYDKHKKAEANEKAKAAASSLSSLQTKLETAYTTVSGWAEFEKGQESVVTHYYQTQTDEPVLGALVAEYATNTASDAHASFVSVLQAQQTGQTGKAAAKVDQEAQNTLMTYIATQTYLPDEVKKSVQSDWALHSQLVGDIRSGGSGNGDGKIACIVGGVFAGVIALVAAL